jgi:alkylhydroperoxidase family enzyme
MENSSPPPRIAPLEPPYEPEAAALLEKWMPPGSGIEPLALFRTLCIHDELASRMRPLGAGLLGHGRLEPRDRELVILRTCARARAEYEWGVHAVAYGAAVALDDAQIAATADGAPDDPAFSASDGDLIRLADELHETCMVSDALWSALSERFAADQLLELLVLAGWYRLIAYVINGGRVTHEPWARQFPARV